MLPSLNPLAAPAVLCPICGTLIQPEAVRIGKGKVTEVTYSCVNEDKSCAWMSRATLSHVSAEGPFPVPEKELKERRETLAAAKEIRETRERGISTLIQMLPRLNRILAELEPESHAPAGEKQLESASTDTATGGK